VRRHAAAAAGVTGTLRFNTIMLQEPPKAELLAYQHGAGPKPQRRALVWVLNPPKGDLFEAVVGLPEGAGAAAGAADVVHAWAKVRRCCSSVLVYVETVRQTYGAQGRDSNIGVSNGSGATAAGAAAARMLL
jgi:hypothetical protein